MDFELTEILGLLTGATICCPKSVMMNDDIYLESKVLFSQVFTDAVALTGNLNCSPETVSQNMKKILKGMDISDVQFYCCCNETKARYAQREVLHLISHTNISECLKARA